MTRPRVSRTEWETQYRSGRWDYLGAQGEAIRYDYLAAFARRTGAQRVLDVGCGSGLLREALGGDHFTGAYLGMDWSLTALPRGTLPPRHLFLCADANRLPVLSASFDLIVVGEVLYYLDDPGESLRSMHQLLSPGGALLVSCYQPPADSGSRWLPVVARLEELLYSASGGKHPVKLEEPSNGRVWHIHHVLKPPSRPPHPSLPPPRNSP